MKFHKPVLLLAEIRESFFMAMGAVTAHKLRSALTLLGVLVGVFSIIVVMTAMRVMQSHIESSLARSHFQRAKGKRENCAAKKHHVATGFAV
jgi:ABC-type lipoprotein release transport system permease subunit